MQSATEVKKTIKCHSALESLDFMLGASKTNDTMKTAHIGHLAFVRPIKLVSTKKTCLNQTP